MTPTRRTILLLTNIFMVLAAFLAFCHFASISSQLPELRKSAESPELMSVSTLKADHLKAIATAQMNLTIAVGTLDICSKGILLYGALLCGGGVIHFLATPWKRSDKSS